MHVFKSHHLIPGDPKEIWKFFSSPENLSKITPSNMGFKILEPKDTSKMYEGMIITYKVSPLLGIPMNWMTEITKIKEGEFFIDNQLNGPYKVWHHEHHFKKIDGGVEMNDIVHYVIPFGPIGRFMNSIFIAGQVKKIFDFRTRKIEEVFGTFD